MLGFENLLVNNSWLMGVNLVLNSGNIRERREEIWIPKCGALGLFSIRESSSAKQHPWLRG